MVGTVPNYLEKVQHILDELCRIVSSQEKSASRVYLSYSKAKGFDPARLFAKTQAQTVFSVTRELRVLIKKIDQNELDTYSDESTVESFYPEKQPAFDQGPLNLES